MKNKLVINNEDKDTFEPIAMIDLEDSEYLIYTDGSTNSSGDTVAFASKYSFDGKKQVLTPVDSTETLEFLDEILINLERKVNKEIGK